MKMKKNNILHSNLAMDFIICLTVLHLSKASAETAPTIATTCVACHGQNGISAAPIWPNLAGQKEAYLVKQLKDFRSGARKDPVMAPLTMNLSDEDIDKLAKFYSNQK